MPDMDSTFLKIACWKYIVVSDLSRAFYQIPLAKNSMKYCGVITHFKGVCVYTRCAMGIPRSETALEELMCRVLGDLLQEGCVQRLLMTCIAVVTLIRNFFQTGGKSSLLLIAATFTSLLPKLSTSILGWILGRYPFLLSFFFLFFFLYPVII